MKNWTDMLVSDKAIRSIYQEEIPSLSNVELHEVILNTDAVTLSLRFDLNSFPNTLPKKWIAGNYNRVQLSFSFWEVENLVISGWSNRIFCSIVLERLNRGIFCNISSNSFACSFKAGHLYLEKISAYKFSPEFS